ncbi:TetR/AcrR family transcriptional regulator [Micromonosporaceae bacterium Da 78-11]
MGIETLRIPGRRDRKKQQTRSALMIAALRLVDERGLDRVTVEDISAAVDVSPRTFFNYFATKDDALIGDQITDGATLPDRLRALDPAVPVLDAIRQVLSPAVEQIQAERDLWLLRMRVISNNPSLLPTLFARGMTAEREFIVAVADRTGFAADDAFPPLIAAVTSAAFRTAMVRWAAADDTRQFAGFVDEAFGLLAAGLAQPAPISITEEVPT